MENEDLYQLAPDAVRIHSGFPNPAFDSEAAQPRGAAERFGTRAGLALSLDQLLVKHPSSSYLFRISGNQWSRYGIFGGDIALIDRAPAPLATDCVIFWQNDSFALCRFARLPKGEEPWGVVTAVIHRFQQ